MSTTIKVLDPSMVPPGGAFVYVQPETGSEFRFHTLEGLVARVILHREANGLPHGNPAAEVEAYVCQHQPGVCGQQTEAEKVTILDLVARFSVSMVQWMKDGMRVVSPRQFRIRRELCEACRYWKGEGSQWWLGRCRKCGCSGLKLHLASEVCPINRWGKQ